MQLVGIQGRRVSWRQLGRVCCIALLWSSLTFPAKYLLHAFGTIQLVLLETQYFLQVPQSPKRSKVTNLPLPSFVLLLSTAHLALSWWLHLQIIPILQISSWVFRKHLRIHSFCLICEISWVKFIFLNFNCFWRYNYIQIIQIYLFESEKYFDFYLK